MNGLNALRVGVTMMLGAAFAVHAQTELANLSLEELLNIKVSIVSRRPERLADAPAAVFVITRDDIRRSGVTSIPDALRLVPGLQVARIDANKWAITSRGFADLFANKLLVMIDGRSVYTPLFSGVFWDAQQVPMDDIERIEVIRGPGASLWGSNAVNGIINVVTRDARESAGGYVRGVVGSEDRGIVGLRYGAQVGSAASYRLYGRYFDRDKGADAPISKAHDAWHGGQGGFRADWSATPRDELTFAGDLYRGTVGQTYSIFTSPLDEEQQIVSGEAATRTENVLARWRRSLSPTSNLSLALYYDHARREEIFLTTEIRTFDVDFQHRCALGKRHVVTWGVGYRRVHDRTLGDFPAAFHPSSARTNLASAFVQDEVTIMPDRLHATAGTKMEHNTYTGWEFQPTVRLLATPHRGHTVWAAISRAVRTPSRAEVALEYVRERVPSELLPPNSPATFAALVGNPNWKSEDLIAYELGYRTQPTESFSADVAAFYNVYHNLRSVFPREDEVRLEGSPPYFVIPFTFRNELHGATYGGEISAKWQAADRWRLSGTYSRLNMNLVADPGGNASDWEEGYSPVNQWSVRSSTDLPHSVYADAWFRYVGRLTSGSAGSYLTADARLAWRPTSAVELSLVGRNLLDSPHVEFTSAGPAVTLYTQVERGVYGAVAWHF